MNPLSIDIKNLSYSYIENGNKKSIALDNVNVTIPAGEFMGIIGPNGGGKTTLVRLITGLLPIQSGSICINTLDTRGQKEHFLGKPHAIGYVPQKFPVDATYPITVERLISLGLTDSRSFFPRISSHQKSMLRDVLEKMHILHLAQQKAGTLSGGELKKVLIARAIISRPGLLILDEPAAGLDPGAETELFSLLRDINLEMTILIVSHDLSFVNDHVQRVLCVHKHVHVHETQSLTPEIAANLFRSNVRLIDHHHDD